MDTAQAIIIGYFGVLNLIGLVVTLTDKYHSLHKDHRRVPEKTLFLIASLGGSIGTLLAMLFAWHKIRKILVVTIIVALAAQQILLLAIFAGLL
ncbi:MAG: DUF1294 domain-containing protein [Candidatus Doudnabacteria bacterium]